ncbi:SurA N-terminal domain-containing protein [Candidatus Thiothrix sp. Deng01]|uniref:Periplasmic chaperone PpiD n=1 Tax=Candidatus Thiothrix phosphatis TaxID=3112415 RepID=A0ABU6D4L2_9GAMM|nr:SurA N-terminal domain-containing protein [Candidatus Thiothrix sp. Deng01]MEB4593603.1 SurA N-terminal domain-containing protein [Candidatus Thiothrix sp. Deng01]
MLQSIHDKAKGWIAYLVVGLITIPFALFGINQYFEGGGKRAAAVVNGEEISTQEVQNALLQMKQQFGGQLPPGMDEALKGSALESVINQALLRQKIKEDGYRASNQEVADAIAAIEVFQKDGKFDKATYEGLLKMQRRDPTAFEEQVRHDLSQQQLRSAVLETAFLPKAEAEQYQALQQQQRDLETFTLKVAAFQPQVQITEEQIGNYYEQHKTSYMTDEKVQLAYLELKRDDLAAKLKVDDATLQKWFDDNSDHYVQPEERIASHILVSVDEPAKDADAKKRIDALYADIQSKKRTFEEVARTDSDDKISAEKDGLLGVVVASDWGPEFMKAVSALKVGEMSAPVKTEAGYEIIRVQEIKPAKQKTFAEAREMVDKDYRAEQSDKEFQDKGEVLGRVAYEQDGDLAPAAKETGLTVQQTGWVTRVQGEGVAASQKLREAAFGDDVLTSGKNSDLLELEDGHAVVIRVVNHEAAAQKPLAEVHDEIRNILLAEDARKLTTQKGEELLKKLRETSSWAALTETGVEATVDKLGLVGRADGKLPPEVLEKAFAMNHPAQDKPVWAGASLSNGDYVIIALKAIKPGESKLDAAGETAYEQGIGSRELGAFLQGMRESADVVTHPENL